MTLARLGRSAFIVLFLCATAARGEAAPKPAVEPNASRLLAAAVGYLNGQPAYAFAADISYDDVQPSGLKYVVRATAQFSVQRPGDFFVNYAGDRRKASFYGNGKTFVFFDQSAGVYGTMPAAGDIDGTLGAVFAKSDFTVPLADFVSNHPGAAFTRGVHTGFDLGPSTIGTFATHHLLFSTADIDWQIWIDDGATPLVRAFTVTYKKLPSQPQYNAVFHDWKFAPIDESTFTFTPPKGAIAVPIAGVSKTAPSGAKK